MNNDQPFLTDVKQLRAQARQCLEQGPVTPTYQGDVKQTIDILQTVLATEIVCVLRYTQNAIAATGISSESVKEEFEEHAKEEQQHIEGRCRAPQSTRRNPKFQPGWVGHALSFTVFRRRRPRRNDQRKPDRGADRL
jgi:bacterioferritin